jgi:N-acetylmuramoyl-L-alanine amidase
MGQQSPLSQTGVPPQNPIPQPQQPPPLLIMLDPAHGGADAGAALSAAFPEKDVTLVLARRLHQDLISRGLPVQVVRDSDVTLSPDQRAATVNALHPALYIAIHATSQGSGIRLFTAMLPDAGENRGPFLDWQTAQSGSLARSRLLREQIAAAMQKSGFPIRSLTAPLRPLNNVIVPAIAVEVAPAAKDVSQLASPEYQQSVSTALANGIASIAPQLRIQVGRAQ